MQSIIPKWLIYTIMAVAMLGFIDATYLAVLHFVQEVPPCSIIRGCEIVTRSIYSEIFGIPVALLGSLYYLSVFSIAFYYLKTLKFQAGHLLAKITWAGVIASGYFLYLQLFVLKAICLFCMISIATSTTLLILAWTAKKKYLVREL